MSPRRILRIVLSAAVLVLVWTRLARQWHAVSTFWVAGALAISIILLLVILAEVTGVQDRWRRQRDQVPDKPLGLDG